MGNLRQCEVPVKENPAGESKNTGLKLQFDRHLRLEFRGAKVTTDAGLLAVRELDEALGLTEIAGEMIKDNRTSQTCPKGQNRDIVSAFDIAFDEAYGEYRFNLFVKNENKRLASCLCRVNVENLAKKWD